MNSSASSSSVNSGGGNGNTDSDLSETVSKGSAILDSELSGSNYGSGVGNAAYLVRNSTLNIYHHGHQQSDEQIYKMAPEAVDPAILSRGCLSLRRYTRSALLSIRDDVMSKCRPECVGDPRLANLGFWRHDSAKVVFRGNGNGSGLSTSTVNNSKNVMDHRSISSSHLMPAFMKRQATTISKTNQSNNNLCCGGNGPVALTQINESSKDATPMRHRKDAQHQVQHQDIILSPQRKSINMGCQMPAATSQYPDRELTNALRERRIGSGRLPPRDVNWDYRPDKETSAVGANNDENYNATSKRSGGSQSQAYHNVPAGNSGQEYREHRYERRHFGRGSSSGNGTTHNFSSNDRRSKQYDSRSDEPEWLNAGPISQHDTIELRGFDDAEEQQKEDDVLSHKSSTKGTTYSTTTSKHMPDNRERIDIQDAEDEESRAGSNQSPPPARSTPTKNTNDSNNNMNSNCSEKIHLVNINDPLSSDARDSGGVASNQQQPEDRDSKHVNLNLEEILKLDSLNDILVGDSNNRKAGSSKFSQWFKQSSPTNQSNTNPQQDSRRSSLHDDLTNILSADPNFAPHIAQQQRFHPSPHLMHSDTNGENYYSTIPPATTNVRQPNQPNHALLEFLLKNNFIGKNSQPAGFSDSHNPHMHTQSPCPAAGAIPSVEELEARMRKSENVGDNGSAINSQQLAQGQLNKLLGTNATSGVNLNQSHSHLQPQLQNIHRGQNASPPAQQDMETFRKLITALQQQQQQQQQQMVFQQMLLNRSQQQQQRSINQHLQVQQQQLLQKIIQMNGQTNRSDLVKIPEAQTIIQGLPQRIPSPRELQFHTQSIMQNALIKKKLEEQQENYRRRQELEKQQLHLGIPTAGVNLMPGGNAGDNTDPLLRQQFNHSPPPLQQQSQSHNKQVNSPTPLAFTPTSVLRKMTAEKDNFLSNGGSGTTANDAAKTSHAMQTLLLSNVAGAVTVHHQTQPRMILGGGNTLQQQPNQHNQSNFAGSAGTARVSGTSVSPQTVLLHHARSNQAKWNQINMNQMQQLSKPMGRPILKGRSVSIPESASNQAALNSSSPQGAFGTKVEFHHQHQQAVAPQQQLHQQHLQLLQQRQRLRAQQFQQMQYRQQILHKSGTGSGTGVNSTGPGNMPLSTVDTSASSITNANSNQSHIVYSPTSSGAGASGLINVPANLLTVTASTSTSNTVSNSNNSNSSIGINYQRDGGLSPTSNQLARWFSPELLAKASAGKLPSLNMGQALSLEEFERSIQHSSAVVHN